MANPNTAKYASASKYGNFITMQQLSGAAGAIDGTDTKGAFLPTGSVGVIYFASGATGNTATTADGVHNVPVTAPSPTGQKFHFTSPVSASHMSASVGVFGHSYVGTLYVDAGSIIIGGTTLSETEMGYLDGIALGTAEDGKVMSWASDSTWTAAGGTCANLGTVTTVDLNGGSIDGATIGAASAGAGTFTTMTATTSVLGTLGGNVDHSNYNSTNVDIDSGAIDGTTIGAASAAAGSFAALVATTITGTGDMTITGDTATFQSANSADPLVVIKNTTNDAAGARLRFVKDKGAAGADGDDIGVIEFVGDDAAETQTDFAKIFAEVGEADNTDEAGKLTIQVASSDGTTTGLENGIVLTGHKTSDYVDVTLGTGTSSTVTVAGNLTVNGTTTTVNSTTVQIDDLNLQLADGSAAASAVNAGGITLANSGDDFTWQYNHGTTAWKSSIDVDAASGKAYKIAGTSVLNATTLGSAVVNSSLTNLGTLTALVTSGGVNIDDGGDGAIDGCIIGANTAAAGTFAALVGTSLNVSDGNITNVGDLNCDSVSVDAAATGLTVDFSGCNTTKGKITLADNLADALNINEGGTSYMKFTTTNSSEQIVFGKNSTFASTTIADLGSVTTCDINGGAIDGTTIGASSAAAGTFAALVGTSATINGALSCDTSFTIDAVTLDSTELGYLDSTVAGASGTTKAMVTDGNGDFEFQDDDKLVFGTSANASIEYDTAQDLNSLNIANDGYTYFTAPSAGSAKPELIVYGSYDGSGGGWVNFSTDRNGSLATDGDTCGGISWTDGSGTHAQSFAQIWSTATDASGEEGSLTIQCRVNSADVSVAEFGYKSGSTRYGMLMKNNASHGTIKAHSFVTYSDETLKANIIPIESGLDKVMQLQGVSYDWKSDGTADIGFLAQEVEKIVPQAVYGTEDGDYGLDYGSLTAVLAEAIKEQQAQIEDLKAELRNKADR